MKKNIFPILSIAFSIFFLSMSPFQLNECEILAIKVHNSLQEAGMSHADAYHMSGIIQDFCEQDLM